MGEGVGEGDKGQTRGNLPKRPEHYRQCEAFKRLPAEERLRLGSRQLIQAALRRTDLREQIRGDQFQGY